MMRMMAAPVTHTLKWIPELGIDLVFILDGLSLVFGLLVAVIGALVFLYAFEYMKAYRRTGRFYLYLALFAVAMMGLVFSGNMVQLFIFWELTSFLSFLLISFFHEKESSRKAAFQSLFITGFGGLSLLAGIILTGTVTGSYELGVWISQAEAIRESPVYLPALLLILTGVFTKSAQFPFHFWLPGAMAAPAPVSAYLHSATMVKAGFFLLLRLNPVLGGTAEWNYIVSLAGLLTMLAGSYFAITRFDIKSILAFTTINALGILVLLAGIDTRLSIKAALLFMFVHATYKAALFMIAGMIEKKTGTRDIGKLGGLARSMPVTFVVTLLMVLSMAGLPPMLGFMGKELIYEAKSQLPGISSVILILGVLSNILMVAISMLFITRVFLGKPAGYEKKPDEKGVLFLAGPAILALFSLFAGMFPQILGGSLIEQALNVVIDADTQVKLKLWHGFTRVFFLSLATVVSGLALFLFLLRRQGFLERWNRFNLRVFSIQLSDVFSGSIDWFVRLSARNTRLLQHGYHRYYLMTIILFATGLLWYQVYYTRGWTLLTVFSLQPFYVTGLVLVIMMGTLFATMTKSRIGAIIAMGAAGYGISLVYLFYSAVDLAITMLIVETVIVVMFIAVLQKFPGFAILSSKASRMRDLAIALAFGSVMTVIALKAINVEFQHPVSDYFIENSYIKAFGRNVVNVILVDFRALDTLGEVLVLVLAAMGVSLLLRKKHSVS